MLFLFSPNAAKHGSNGVPTSDRRLSGGSLFSEFSLLLASSLSGCSKLFLAFLQMLSPFSSGLPSPLPPQYLVLFFRSVGRFFSAISSMSFWGCPSVFGRFRGIGGFLRNLAGILAVPSRILPSLPFLSLRSYGLFQVSLCTRFGACC